MINVVVKENWQIKIIAGFANALYAFEAANSYVTV